MRGILLALILALTVFDHASQAYPKKSWLKYNDYYPWLDNNYYFEQRHPGYDKLERKQSYEPVSDNDVDKLIEDAYLDALLRSLQKRAEPPRSNQCTERSNIETVNATNAKINLRFPAISPRKPDQYMCTSIPVPYNGRTSFVVNYTPHASMEHAHHMLVFGCSKVFDKKSWNCGMGGTVCNQGASHTLWAWARNAPGLKLPKNVGFEIGAGSSINYIVVQIHYAHAFQEGQTDCSGVTLDVTTKPQPFLAGIFLLGAGTIDIPPHSANVSAVAMCMDTLPSDVTVFAFRTHTHARGTVVTGMRYRDGQFKMIGKGNPQWPQSFYPRVGGSIVLKHGDYLYAECLYTNKNNWEITAGATASDEMCNFYMMFYTEDKSIIQRSPQCWDVQYNHRNQLLSAAQNMPASMDTPAPYPGYAGKDSDRAIQNGAARPIVPPIHIHGASHDEEDMDMDNDSPEDMMPMQEAHSPEAALQQLVDQFADDHDVDETSDASKSRGHGFKADKSIEDIHLVSNWLDAGSEFIGQVGGVALDDEGFLYVFHRGHTIWDAFSYNAQNVYQHQSEPIQENVVLKLNPDSGSIIHRWGAKMFFMPHGATVDPFNNLWLTDVAMHQVFRFPLDGAQEADVTLGEKFVPGNDIAHFCKPAGTAIDRKGFLYVADGYCNGRVIKFTYDGVYVTQWGKMATNMQIISGISPPPGVFFVVHSLALTTNDSEIWIADRQNGRIQCYTTDGKFLRIIQDKKNMGSLIFAISFSNLKDGGGLIHGVNGPYEKEKVEGFTIDYETHQLVNKWGGGGEITHPHAITCFHDGSQMFVGQLEDTRVLKYKNDAVILPEADIVLPGSEDEDEEAKDVADKKSMDIAPSDDDEASDDDARDEVVNENTEMLDEMIVPIGDNEETAKSDKDEAKMVKSDAADEQLAKSSPDSEKSQDDDGVVYASREMNTGPIIAIIAVLLVLPTLIILATFLCIRMRKNRLKEYHGLLSRSTSASKFTDKEKPKRGKPSINLGKFFKKSEVDKSQFSRVATEADSEDDDAGSESDVELFKKPVASEEAAENP